ncbi:VOC family protein [Fulvivirgaceae bacterium BMA10]|uniref:VOC family protein n=1 Tax=Splendidivirga corallicola TaxID=3051826 RepID=A0ABT8KLG0_9BACT|nr:VOC family protein [Fulvivirgaceae bacterium BMA10]
MKIEHIAIWVRDLERMKSFYTTYFNGLANDRYVNQSKGFSSYFISFSSGSRLELMHSPEIPPNLNNLDQQNLGLIHFAISVGSKEKVDQLTNILKTDGYEVIGNPRTTGDGYYESVVLDPENNRIEITI